MKRFLFVFTIFLAAQTTGYAQSTSAGVTGVVADPTGAVIQNAIITSTNTETNQTRTVVTNGDGIYSIAPLPVGKYEVKISATGFKDLIFKQVVLNVGQTVTLDAVLTVSGVNYEVDGPDAWAPPLVDTEGTKVDAVIGTREIENLPLNGRNYLELALLTPGNAPAPNFDPTKSNTVLISSAGQLGRGGNVMLDGTDNNDDMVGGSLINISQDAVQEFQVTTNRFSAEFGRSGSSIINVVTKSGTNSLRGFFF